MSRHPYEDLPDHCFWHRSVPGPGRTADPVIRPAFTLPQGAKVATIGTAFSSMLGSLLDQHGLVHLVTETCHPAVRTRDIARYGYGEYTARYGAMTTSRQVLQTLERAIGRFTPVERPWPGLNGRVLDPFRPTIQPDGFVNELELQLDGAQHARAIGRAMRQMDAVVISLSAIDCWSCSQDGAVLPIRPDFVGADLDSSRHMPLRLSMVDVVSDLRRIIRLIRMRNPSLLVILAVHPEAIAETPFDESVLTADMLAKSTLRAAMEEVADEDDTVAYFPLMEVITWPRPRGPLLEPDRRRVSMAGLRTACRLFLQHYAPEPVAPPPATTDPEAVPDYLAEAERLAQVMCDEIVLARRGSDPSPR